LPCPFKFAHYISDLGIELDNLVGTVLVFLE
jgi:hypothetical protein